MRTRDQVQERLKQTKKTRKVTDTRFRKYDNCDDMHYLDVLDAEITLLEWVLSE
jgi:hypothetical protein